MITQTRVPVEHYATALQPYPRPNPPAQAGEGVFSLTRENGGEGWRTLHAAPSASFSLSPGNGGEGRSEGVIVRESVMALRNAE
jgi:hypothetical protein